MKPLWIVFLGIALPITSLAQAATPAPTATTTQAQPAPIYLSLDSGYPIQLFPSDDTVKPAVIGQSVWHNIITFKQGDGKVIKEVPVSYIVDDKRNLLNFWIGADQTGKTDLDMDAWLLSHGFNSNDIFNYIKPTLLERGRIVAQSNDIAVTNEFLLEKENDRLAK